MQSFIRMKQILFLILTLKSIKEINCSSISVTGFCGDPGRPLRSQLSPDQITYSEEEPIVYKCDDYISLKQFRKCVKGKWTARNAVCGNSYRNNDLKLARIFNKENASFIREYNTSNLEAFAKFGNSFIAERYAIPLRAYGSKSYRIELYVNSKAMFQLVRISLSVVNHLIDEKIRETKFNITRVTVSPYRECVLNSESSVSPWLHNSTRFDFWFSCESRGQQQYEQELKDMSDLVTIETESDDVLDLDLATFILAHQYTNDGNPREPICGTPEVPVGLESHVIHHQTKYAFKCAKGFRRLDNFGGDTHELVCGIDMKWKGSLPQCFPQKTCKKFLLSDKHLTEVYLYEKVYYHNNSLWFAIEGTKAHFRCKSETQIFVGKEIRVCGKDGEWSDSLPNCLNTENGSKLNLTTIIIIVMLTLILTFSLTALLIYCYIKVKRNRSKQLSSRHSNIYADYDLTYDEPKQFDAQMYETIGISDDRYADNRINTTPLYIEMSAMSDTKQNTNNNENLFYDDCTNYTAHRKNVKDSDDSYVVMKVN